MRNLDKFLVAEEDPGLRRQFNAGKLGERYVDAVEDTLESDGLERPLPIKEMVLLGTPAWVARPRWLNPLRSLITHSRAGRSLICLLDHNSARQAAKAHEMRPITHRK